jgi:transposase
LAERIRQPSTAPRRDGYRPRAAAQPAPDARFPSRAEPTAATERARFSFGRIDWAALLKGVYDVDALACPCGGRLRLIALALAVKERLALDPESGALFVFAGKRGNRLKVLWFDHNGYCILYKRLHRARFALPQATDVDRPLAHIDARALVALLRGVEKHSA